MLDHIETLDGGFPDAVAHAQEIFRAVMDAMARPGTLGHVEVPVAPPAPLGITAIAPKDAVEVTVLDEADHMADLGFLPAVKRLLDATPNGQRMLFSATLDKAVDGLVQVEPHAGRLAEPLPAQQHEAVVRVVHLRAGLEGGRALRGQVPDGHLARPPPAGPSHRPSEAAGRAPAAQRQRRCRALRSLRG